MKKIIFTFLLAVVFVAGPVWAQTGEDLGDPLFGDSETTAVDTAQQLESDFVGNDAVGTPGPELNDAINSGGSVPVNNNSSASRSIENPLAGNITNIAAFLRLILNTIVLPIGGMICVFFIIYAGFLFVSAQGNEDKLKDAKSALMNAIIGTGILLASVAIITAIEATLNSILK